MNAILHRMGNLLEAEYFPLLALNAVALIIIYGLACFGQHCWAKWILRVFPAFNAPVVLLLIFSIIDEAHTARALHGAERGMGLGILMGFSPPVCLEFLLLLAAWSRLRAQSRGQIQTG